MWGEGHGPERRTQGRVEGQGRGRHGVHPALPPLREALTAALRQRVAQHAARAQPASLPLAGYLCECCLDAPAVLVQPAPWGGDMGVCATCQQETPVSDEEPEVR